MKDVFISYKSTDLDAPDQHTGRDIMSQIRKKLGHVGITCWAADEMNDPGPYPPRIVNAIKECKVFLVILNQGADASLHLMSEVGIAFSRLNDQIESNSPPLFVIIPYIIGDFIPNPSSGIEYYINRMQCLKGRLDPEYKIIRDKDITALVQYIKKQLNEINALPFPSQIDPKEYVKVVVLKRSLGFITSSKGTEAYTTGYACLIPSGIPLSAGYKRSFTVRSYHHKNTDKDDKEKGKKAEQDAAQFLLCTRDEDIQQKIDDVATRQDHGEIVELSDQEKKLSASLYGDYTKITVSSPNIEYPDRALYIEAILMESLDKIKVTIRDLVSHNYEEREIAVSLKMPPHDIKISELYDKVDTEETDYYAKYIYSDYFYYTGYFGNHPLENKGVKPSVGLC